MYGIMSVAVLIMAGSVLLWGQEPQLDGVSLISLTDKYDQATEIKAKYKLEDRALVREAKSDPKDRIEVVIGNKIDPELFGAETTFEPTLEISRWDEVSFKIIPDISDVALKDRTLTFNKEKIIFETPKVDYEIYEYTKDEGGMKYDKILKEKPISNKFIFDIEFLNLDFFFQPPLNEEMASSTCTATDCGGSHRPIEVVGSWAIYHSGNPVNYVGGKEYKTGKFGHLYRPKATDANGDWVWCDLFIDANQGIYKITIDQKWLDTAIYPVRF